MLRTNAMGSMRRGLLIIANLTTSLALRTTVSVALATLALIGTLLTYTVPKRSLMVPERTILTILLTISLAVISMV
jgi:hypothetical protein